MFWTSHIGQTPTGGNQQDNMTTLPKGQQKKGSPKKQQTPTGGNQQNNTTALPKGRPKHQKRTTVLSTK